VRADWYAATVDREPEEVSAWMERLEPLAELLPGRGAYGYERGAELRAGDRVLARMWWGGVNGKGVHVVGTGDRAEGVLLGLREAFPGHRVTRLDVCEDWDKEGLFDKLVPILLRIADEYGVQVRHVGDWHRAEKGRTLYLGAGSSAVQVRLYEKGRKEGPHAPPGWVRAEIEVKPKGQAQRVAYGRILPANAWGACRWSSAVAAEVLGLADLEAVRVGTAYKPGDRERALYWLGTQYGGLLEELAGEKGGWEAVGPFLRDVVAAIREEQRQVA
jgi:hypothetical protein